MRVGCSNSPQLEGEGKDRREGLGEWHMLSWG